MLKDAGFIDITVTDESSYQIDVAINKPRTQALMDEASVTEDEIRNLGGYFVSIKVMAKKP
jgi:hypothetical protein